LPFRRGLKAWHRLCVFICAVVVGQTRKAQAKFAALAGAIAGTRNRSAVQFDQALDQCEADAQAAQGSVGRGGEQVNCNRLFRRVGLIFDVSELRWF
jgi:hypothetical protein